MGILILVGRVMILFAIDLRSQTGCRTHPGYSRYRNLFSPEEPWLATEAGRLPAI